MTYAAGSKWDKKEEARASIAFTCGASIPTIARNLGRTGRAIECRLYRLGFDVEELRFSGAGFMEPTEEQLELYETLMDFSDGDVIRVRNIFTDNEYFVYRVHPFVGQGSVHIHSVNGLTGNIQDIPTFLSQHELVNKETEMSKGYYVIGLQGRAPTVIHETGADARREAERLARKNPGQRFVVAEIKDTFLAKQRIEVEVS